MIGSYLRDWILFWTTYVIVNSILSFPVLTLANSVGIITLIYLLLVYFITEKKNEKRIKGN